MVAQPLEMHRSGLGIVVRAQVDRCELRSKAREQRLVIGGDCHYLQLRRLLEFVAGRE